MKNSIVITLIIAGAASTVGLSQLSARRSAASNAVGSPGANGAAAGDHGAGTVAVSGAARPIRCSAVRGE